MRLHARDGPAQGPARGRRRDRRQGSRSVEADFVVVGVGLAAADPGLRARVDGERILTTRQSYPPPEIPEHVVIVGSGVTGVEFTHMFDALGSTGDADRVAPAGAADEGPRGRGGARGRVPPPRREAAEGCRGPARSSAPATSCASSCDDGRVVEGSHAVLAVGSIPNTDELRLDAAGVEIDERRLHPDQPPLPLERGAHLRGRRRLGEAAAVVGRGDAGPQDRRAPDGPAQPRRTATSTTTRRVRDLHRPGDRRRRARRGRGVRGRSQDPGDEGAVLVERQGAHQGRPARVREDRLRPGDRRRARRLDRRAQRRRAHLRDRGRGDERPEGRTTSSTRCSSTPPSPNPSPKPRPDPR